MSKNLQVLADPTLVIFLENEKIWFQKKLQLGGIQQLRGQQGGEGGLAKSPRLSTKGGGVLLISTWTENWKKL